MYKEVFNASYTKGAIKEVWSTELFVARVEEVPRHVQKRFESVSKCVHVLLLRCIEIPKKKKKAEMFGIILNVY